MNITKYYVDVNGLYLGGFEGCEPDVECVEVHTAPSHGLDTWDGLQWNANPQVAIDAKVQEHKQTLADTDFKMTVDYYATLSKEEANELKYLRSVAREYVRSYEA